MVTKRRSPNYPQFSINEAVRFVNELYQKFGSTQFTMVDAADAWNHKGVSGTTRSRIASLRQFGMVEGKRGEHPRLTRLAITLSLQSRESPEFRAALKEASGNPPIFNELRETRPSASDAVLREYLVVDRDFTDDGARRLIEILREAEQIGNLDSMSQRVQHELLEDQGTAVKVFPPYAASNLNAETVNLAPLRHSFEGNERSVPLPVSGGDWPVLTGNFPMKRARWDEMLAILSAMEKGLVIDEWVDEGLLGGSHDSRDGGEA
jgi:hypothetical protein